MARIFVGAGWSWRRWSAVGAGVLLLSSLPLAVAAADDGRPPSPATPTVRLGAPTGNPEKDTVALERPPVRVPAGARKAEAVRVGQGLRPDGTELAVSEVPRPWLIRE